MSIKGIDVAKYQPTNPDPAALPGISFYIAKATEGTTPDPTYSAHIAHARSQGIPLVGAYHFADNRVPIPEQIDAFLHYAVDADGYCIDREGAYPLTQSEFTAFLTGFHSKALKLGLYGSESGYPSWGQDWRWVANYSHEPTIPYHIWQYGPYAPNVDGDVSKLSVASIANLWGAMTPQLDITDLTPAMVTTGNNATWYDLDGSVLLTGKSEIGPRISPYAVAGGFRAIYVDWATGGTATRVCLIKPVTTTPVPKDCTTEIAAAIAHLKSTTIIVDPAPPQIKWGT